MDAATVRPNMRRTVSESCAIPLSLIWFAIVACGGPFTGAEDIVVPHPAQAVRDARDLIEKRRAEPSRFDRLVTASELPESLRIENLHHASVHEDHVDLVVARNPDWSIGGRIWAVEHRPHRDEKTKYRDIYFYAYTNDAPESAENIK